MLKYEFFAKASQLLKEDRFDDLSNLVHDYIKALEPSKESEEALEDVISVIQKPVISSNIEKWAEAAGLTGLKIVDYVTKLIISTKKFSYEEKVELAKRMAAGEPLLDFKGMIKGSINKSVSPSAYYNEKRY